MFEDTTRVIRSRKSKKIQRSKEKGDKEISTETQRLNNTNHKNDTKQISIQNKISVYSRVLHRHALTLLVDRIYSIE